MLKSILNFIYFLYKKMRFYKSHDPVTFEYPYSNKHVHLFSRLEIKNNFSECIGCKICESACPVDAITIEGEDLSYNKKKPKTPKGYEKELELSSFQIDYSRCIFCGICISDCPTNCLYNEKKFVKAANEIRILKRDLKREELNKIKGVFS